MPNNTSPAATELLALIARMKDIHGELTPLKKQYRLWAREYQRTGVAHDPDEFNELVDSIRILQDEALACRAALNALASLGANR